MRTVLGALGFAALFTVALATAAEFHGDPLRCEREFLQQIAQLRFVL